MIARQCPTLAVNRNQPHGRLGLGTDVDDLFTEGNEVVGEGAPTAAPDPWIQILESRPSGPLLFISRKASMSGRSINATAASACEACGDGRNYADMKPCLYTRLVTAASKGRAT